MGAQKIIIKLNKKAPKTRAPHKPTKAHKSRKDYNRERVKKEIEEELKNTKSS